MRLIAGILFFACCLLVAQGLAQEATDKPVRKPGHVLVQFLTVPIHAKATVYHGRKKLGQTPIYLQFPKNSGPRDVVLKRGGYLWVNTRANTFKDDKVVVKMTKVDEASTLFGYREALVPDGGVDGGLTVDGGAPTVLDAGVQPTKPTTP